MSSQTFPITRCSSVERFLDRIPRTTPAPSAKWHRPPQIALYSWDSLWNKHTSNSAPVSGYRHDSSVLQGLYRNLTGFPDFSRKKLLLFPHFSSILFIFMWTKTLQNWLLNAEISYTMYSIPNTKWDSNFWTLNFKCFVSWTARKWTNAWVINSVIDICIFQVNITVFKDFSRLFHTYDHFQDLPRPWKFLH